MYPRLLAAILLAALPMLSSAGNNPLIIVNDTRDLPGLFAGVCDADHVLPGEQCTLRAAVQLANSRAGEDTIVLILGSTYPLTLSGEGGANIGDLDITDDLLISGIVVGMPADTTGLPIIDASGLGDRIFDIAAGVDVDLRGLQLTGANPGAIRNGGDLFVDRCRIADNGGGTSAPAIHLSAAAARLQVFESHFQGNHSTGSSAAIYVGSGRAVIRRSSFRDNWGGSSNAAIDVFLNGEVEIENSTIAGHANAWIGIRAINPALVSVRNSTVLQFPGNALRIANLQPARPVDIANSILAGGNHSCEILLGGAAGDVRIGHSLVQSQAGCAGYYQNVIEEHPPTLSGWAQQPAQVHWYRPPHNTAEGNLVDRGIAPNQMPAVPAQACTLTDQRGVARPQDGILDGIARCDLGAVEINHPNSMVWVVNYADEDLFDANVGNGVCETAPGNGQCTLRAAIAEANARPGLDGIAFATAPGQPIELTLPTGGDLDISDELVIHGAAANGRPQTTLRQQVAGERLFEIHDGHTLLRNLRLTGGDSTNVSGGAVRVAQNGSATLQNVEAFGNRSGVAGGAVSAIGGFVHLLDADLYDNEAPADGAALYVGDFSIAIVERSSLWGNTTNGPGGWALFAGEEAFLSVEASTIAGNVGGGVRSNAGYLSVSASTIAGNTGTGLSVLMNEDNHLFDLHTSIIAGNTGQDCFVLNVGGAGSVGRDYNLIQDGSCLEGSPTSFAADPLLSPLTRAEGRLSRFMRPQYVANGPSSPALDVAPAWSGCGAIDQRGLHRPFNLQDIPDTDGACDLGAVEVRGWLDGDRIFVNGFEQGPQLN